MPLTSACESRSSTEPWRQARSASRSVDFALHGLGERDQPLGRVRPAVQEHVLDELEQVLGDLLVDRELAGVDDPHVEAGADRVVEERRVHRLAHHVVAAEREREVGHAAAHLRPGAGPLDAARRLDERDGVVVVLLDAGGDREDVRVEDDVLGREADLLGEDAIGALADLRPCARPCRPGPSRRTP